MLVGPCEGELHARSLGGGTKPRRQSATPRGAPRLPPTRQERNVIDHLPERDRQAVKARLRRAWKDTKHDRALEQLTRLATEPDRAHPGAAASLREGMEETLTVTRLGITGKLKLTLQSTNPCESMIATVRGEHGYSGWVE
jgi:transposase-like protein